MSSKKINNIINILKKLQNKEVLNFIYSILKYFKTLNIYSNEINLIINTINEDKLDKYINIIIVLLESLSEEEIMFILNKINDFANNNINNNDNDEINDNINEDYDNDYTIEEFNNNPLTIKNKIDIKNRLVYINI